MNNPKEEGAASIPPRYRLSCTECFDALWFCYSPVHQMQQYYRHGVPDSCSEKWSALFDCFNLKTKRSSEVQVCLSSTSRLDTVGFLYCMFLYPIGHISILNS
eukprot:TRINITY_DN915_c0_g1_i1.p1 TRINITY_DN915_c0_g1~~TRINITY_DN915_c0_g1_i1.p1  ORF type:complete len:103 (+),score=14.95 TRINITY_DN915_c0_g1_i1:143-451(+)